MKRIRSATGATAPTTLPSLPRAPALGALQFRATTPPAPLRQPGPRPAKQRRGEAQVAGVLPVRGGVTDLHSNLHRNGTPAYHTHDTPETLARPAAKAGRGMCLPCLAHPG